MKVIFDTNVLLSAFLTDGICARILRRARQKHFSFILCEPVLDETKRLLKNKFSLTAREIAFFISVISEAADEEYHPAGLLSRVSRDPNDDLILFCAAEKNRLPRDGRQRSSGAKGISKYKGSQTPGF